MINNNAEISESDDIVDSLMRYGRISDDLISTMHCIVELNDDLVNCRHSYYNSSCALKSATRARDALDALIKRERVIS